MNGDVVIQEREILAEEIRGMKGWLKFLGIVSIVGGAAYALTLIGIIIAWLPIWLGILLLQAGNAGDRFVESGTVRDLKEHLSKMKLYFKIYGIVTIITFVLVIIFFIIALIAGIASGLFSLYNTGY